MFDVEEIYEAKDLKDALLHKKQHPDSLIIAGGTDVIIKARDCKLRGVNLLSIHGIEELKGVHLDKDNNIFIGSLNSFSNIVHDEIINKYMPTLAMAAETVGSPQIRNVGTIGGNISNGNTSSDTASTLFAYDAVVVLASLDDNNNIVTREVPIEDFYAGPGRTYRKDNEITKGFIISQGSYKNTFGTYIKYSMRDAMDIATLGCSVNVVLDSTKKVLNRIRIAYGVAGPTPLRAKNAEEMYNNSTITEDLSVKIAQAIDKDINPRDSWRASKAFRTHAAKDVTRRAVDKSIALARGDE